MIRIRTGAGWRHDPSLQAALRRGTGAARAAAARAVIDALAVEVDGVDVAAGLAEGRLITALEALLRAVARIVGGAPHATVAFPESDVEILMRRRGTAALLSVVVLSRPSRVVARDVEVEVGALAAAALEASAVFCRELAEILPGAEAREARPLRAAARDLRRTEEGSPPRPRVAAPARPPPGPACAAPVSCAVEIHDEDGHLGAYEGGRPDLGSLLVAGRVALHERGGRELCALPGIPFLVLRDLGAAADALLRAVRAGEPSCTIPLARHGRGAPLEVRVDLEHGVIALPGGIQVPCGPLDLARAFVTAQAELGRIARARNPRQTENAYLAELESAAAERLAQIEELAEGDRASTAGEPTRPPAAPRVPQRPLGPGRLRRIAFRRTFAVDAGVPAGEGLLLAGGVAVIAGSAALAAVRRATGEVLWRAEGGAFAATAAGSVLVVRGTALSALALRSGRTQWTRPLPGGVVAAAAALPRGPLVLVEGGAVTALDPGTGRTLWRFEPPGATRLAVAPFGGVLAIASDVGLLYGLDLAGRMAWRLRAPGPLLRPPASSGGLCLALAASDPSPALLAVDASTGERRWEAVLDLAPTGAPLAWGRRIAVVGTVGGDPVVTVLERTGQSAWSAAPPLEGTVAAAAAGPLLVVRAASGAVVALGRDGTPRWSRPPRSDQGAACGAPPAVARGTVVVAVADGIHALDASTGEIVGAIPGVAPVRLEADAALCVAAMDADGLATGWRLATHLSVL